MAILTRRGLIDLLDEAPIERNLLNRHFIHRLNLLDDQSLATEWELIILSALSRVGLVECEPDLDGSIQLVAFCDEQGKDVVSRHQPKLAHSSCCYHMGFSISILDQYKFDCETPTTGHTVRDLGYISVLG